MATQTSSPGAGRAGHTAGASRRSGRHQPQGAESSDALTRGLGWLSAGLAVPPLAAPGWFGRALGVGDAPRHRAADAFVGVRELVTAAGLLRWRNPAFLWARVAGDIMDLTMLGTALKNHDGRGRERTMAATAAVAGLTIIDVYAAATRSRQKAEMKLTAAVTVTKPPQEVYDQWRRLEHLPEFMAHLEEVRATGPGTTHWRASAPFGRGVEWDAEMISEVPGERIAWRSVGSADVPNEGEVQFRPAPGGRGTEVQVAMCYWIPGGKLGQTIARYFGEDPHQQLDDDLRRFKQIVETGEVVRSEGAPGGKRARQEFPQHPARPLTAKELEEVRS